MILVFWTSNSYATQIESEKLKINNLYFLMMPLDNWTYSESNDSPAARMLGIGPLNVCRRDTYIQRYQIRRIHGDS